MSVPNYSFLACLEAARLVRLARLARLIRFIWFFLNCCLFVCLLLTIGICILQCLDGLIGDDVNCEMECIPLSGTRGRTRQSLPGWL